jgi:hypothetical protein
LIHSKAFKRKIIATLVFSVFAAVAGIIHGIFFDLDFAQLQRFTIEGFFLTFIIFFPGLLLLEWIFDLENHAEWKYLENRITQLEEKLKQKKQ